MQTPIIKIATIEQLKQQFGWNNELTNHQNITILGEKYLISILKEEGYLFDFTIVREEKGKPYFLYNDKIHFSISDTKNYIAVAIYNKRIGIDIEYLRQGKQPIAERFFHPNEIKYLNNILNLENLTLDSEKLNYNIEHQTSQVKYDKAFTQLWTIKEAYVKMTGSGIAGNFVTIDLSPQLFDLQQNYIKNGHQIISFFDINSKLFISICIF